MRKKIYVDAGHGGSDSGCIGFGNVLEKNMNLKISNKLCSILKDKGYEVASSRDRDVYVSLENRVRSANESGADIFVSIHGNAFNKEVYGVETYSYSDATNDLATFVHNEIIDAGIYNRNRGVKESGFYVLRNTKMRACLVEVGFLDNEKDMRLVGERYDEFAQVIGRGIDRYFGRCCGKCGSRDREF